MGISPEVNQKFKDAKKMLYAGLDNSGKTSINMCIKENLVNVGMVKPTYLVERSKLLFLDYEIVQHDMGGQKKYIITYFKEPGKYFQATDILIFVIDIQDENRINESVMYFKDILAQFKSLNITPEIHVLFHKAERYLQEGNAYDAENMATARRIMTSINGGQFPLQFHVTTIMDIWTLSTAFGKILGGLYPKNQLIAELLKETAGKLDAEMIILVDHNLIPIALDVEGERDEKLLHYALPYMHQIKSVLDSFLSRSSNSIKLEWEEFDFRYMQIYGQQQGYVLYLFIIGMKGKVKHDLFSNFGKIFEDKLAGLLRFGQLNNQ